MAKKPNLLNSSSKKSPSVTPEQSHNSEDVRRHASPCASSLFAASRSCPEVAAWLELQGGQRPGTDGFEHGAGKK